MINKMVELVEKLNGARMVYEQGKDEIMSNKEYDGFYDELAELENKTGIILNNSPTQSVGYEVVSNLIKVKHPKKMLSLDKTKDRSKLKQFLNTQNGLLSFKLDGLTIVLTYNNGKLESAITRGNGEIGEDVTHNARVIKNIPKKIPYSKKLVLRGEALITYENFEKINEKLKEDDKYKNPRNLASGTVRQLNSEKCSERNLEWICFEVVEGLENFSSKIDRFVAINSLGFATVPMMKVTSENLFEMMDSDNFNPNKYKYPVDGLVLTFDNIDYSNKLKETVHHPLHSMAFKWADSTVETTLLDVEWNVGRTGVITPTAVFEPIEIEGSTVERASLHNVSIFENLELGIGDTVTVYKANMIIPQVDENLTKSNNLEIPHFCPNCGEKIKIIRENSAFLMCFNPNCSQKLLAKFEHFVSREAMNIDGLSSATLEMLIDKGWIKEFYDLYTIFSDTSKVEELTNMKGWSKKSVDKLILSIDKSREIKLSNLIVSLGIDGIGKAQSKTLVSYYKDVKEFIGAKYDELRTLDGIGDVKAKNIVEWHKENKEILEKLVEQLNIEKQDEKPTVNGSNSIVGKTFVITGTVNHYDNRNALQAEIESLGGKVVGSVSKKTDYLINNDTESTSGKNKKAKELGIPIISEEDYIILKNS